MTRATLTACLCLSRSSAAALAAQAPARQATLQHCTPIFSVVTITKRYAAFFATLCLHASNYCATVHCTLLVCVRATIVLGTRADLRAHYCTQDTGPISEARRRELLDFGFPDDGYDYLKHCRVLGRGSAGLERRAAGGTGEAGPSSAAAPPQAAVPEQPSLSLKHN